jgi:hypothetical protein
MYCAKTGYLKKNFFKVIVQRARWIWLKVGSFDRSSLKSELFLIVIFHFSIEKATTNAPSPLEIAQRLLTGIG